MVGDSNGIGGNCNLLRAARIGGLKRRVLKSLLDFEVRGAMRPRRRVPKLVPRQPHRPRLKAQSIRPGSREFVTSSLDTAELADQHCVIVSARTANFNDQAHKV